MAAMTRNAENLLIEAAKFVDRDPGSPGFLDRFTRAVPAEPALAGRVLTQVLAARKRAGLAQVTLQTGELEVVRTSSGATIIACVLDEPDGTLAASIRVTDAEGNPVSGAALGVTIGNRDDVVVTDPGGRVSVSGTGQELRIRIGRAGAAASPAPDVLLIPLPRRPQQTQYDLVADEAGTAAEETTASPWPVLAGRAKFWGLERAAGYDLTITVEDIGGASGATAGALAVAFMTQDREGGTQRWVVPLAPGPRGLAGSLYSTNADTLVKDSVAVDDSAALLTGLGAQSGEVIDRSVRHADTGGGWLGVAARLPTGRLRDSVQAALARRASG